MAHRASQGRRPPPPALMGKAARLQRSLIRAGDRWMMSEYLGQMQRAPKPFSHCSRCSDSRGRSRLSARAHALSIVPCSALLSQFYGSVV
jgi:hypothetical protein